ncbi:Phage-related minor tail protein [Delftia tsuruhatensis]|uniref:phage tail length tape measure family protein n=1 Tax=Delftia tsuruhatensis TaxID=180282 RepID=UPI001E7C1EA1|nr:phage tail length tape measure family protein [Delftia tsuruhatensis]CAB5709123.1 Phage-related minor tail protein [Delftia tsuruhatensis]CAC9685422.1 Phage-related minor tail protein [Delftia tsuruhatensis]
MTQEGPKAVVSVVAEDNTKEGLDRVKRGIQETAQTVIKAGQEAGKGISKMGEGADQTARKLESFEKSWVNSVQRALVAAEAGEKGTAKYFEAWGKYRGIGGDVMEPILAQLRAVEAAQAAAAGAATKGLGTMGVSAAQTAAALRQVPAQFTDIVVSLQAGQAPLTVLLQQGGQLKDMFGGTAAAAKALGGYVMGLVSPLTLVAAAGAATAVAFHQGAQENEAFVRSIALTGNASGVTTSQLREYARQIDSVVGTQAQAASGLADFVAAGVRGGDELRRYTQTAIEWEKLTGQAVSKTADQFASLQKDPLAAVIKLNEGTNFLTVSVYEQIKALDDQGRKADASKVAMEALDGAMRERGKTIKDSLGYIERGWNAIKGAASDAWDAMLNVGRAATINDQLAVVQKELTALLAQSESGFGETGSGAATGRSNAAYVRKIKERIDALKAEEWALYEKADAEKVAAMQREESTRRMQALLDFDKDYAKALEKETTLQEKLAKVRREGEAAGKSESEIKQVLTYVTEHNKANQAGAKAAKEHAKELAEQAKVYAELAGLSSTYYKDLEMVQKRLAAGKITQEQYVKFVEDLIKKQPFAIALAKEEEKARRDLQKAIEDDIKQADRLADKRQAAIKSAEDAVRKARQEEEAHALAAAANITLAEAVERLTIARLEDQLQMARMGTESQATIDALERELAARKELLGVLQQKGFREGNKKAADEAAKDWDKTAQTISRTLSDYIMAGGKDAAQYLKRLFANLVLEPIVQYGVSSLMGMGGQAAGAASGGFNPLNLLSGGNSAVGMMGTGSLVMNGLTAWGPGGSVMGMLANPGLYAGAELLGAIAPPLLAAFAVFKILKGDWFGSRGPNHAGGVASTATTDRDLTVKQVLGTDAWGNTLGDFTTRANKDLDKQLQTTVNGMLDMYKALAKIGGVNAREIDIAAGFSTNPKYGDEGAMGFFQILDKQTGEVLKKYKDRELDADPQKAWAQFVGDMGGALVAEIKKGDIPGWMRDELDALGEDVTVEGLTAAIQKIAVIDASFKSWANTLVGFNDLNAKAQTALLKTSGGIEALTNNVNAFYAGFYSEAERAEILQRQVREQLKGLGVDIDPKGGEEAKKKFRKLIEDALASGNTELAAKLLALAQLFGVAADAAQKSADTAAEAAKTAADEAAKAVEDARKKAKDAAYANFEAAIQREQKYWQDVASASQEAISGLSNALSTLKSNARDLYGSVDATQQMLAAQGMVYIEDALAGVRGGRKLTDYAGLTDAIGAARGGISSGRYASQFERERDALILAGQLTELAEKGDAQLSVEERQLKASQEQLERLDKTLMYWRDLLAGNDKQIDATLSVEAAIKALEKLMFPDNAGGGGAQPGKDGGGAQLGGGGTGGWDGYKPSKYKRPHTDGSGGTFYNPVIDEKEIAKLDGLSGLYHSFDGTGDLRGLLDAIKSAGGSLSDLSALSGLYESDWRKAAESVGIPAFAIGTNLVPRDTLAVLHQGEAVVPKAFNPWAGGAGGMASGNNNARLEALVAQLIDENRTQAGQIVRLQSQVAKLLQRWDGDGMPQPRKEGEGVAA